MTKLGVLWKNESDGGMMFFSGNFEIDGRKIPIVVFPNRDKKGKQPDWNIYLSEPKGAKKQDEDTIPF
jgi:hypothetical protein